MDYSLAFATAVTQAESILGDRPSAEDVAAESLARIAAGANPDHLGLIVNGLAIDEYRRRQYVTLAEAGEDDELLAPQSALTFEDVEFTDAHDRTLRGLPAPERDAYILTHLRGLTVREAAGVLGTSFKTTHRRAEAARLTIRKELA